MVIKRQCASLGLRAEEGSGTIFEAQGNRSLPHLFTANGLQLTLVYLIDIFKGLNLLNRHLQGSHTSRINHYDSIRAFIEKLE